MTVMRKMKIKLNYLKKQLNGIVQTKKKQREYEQSKQIEIFITNNYVTDRGSSCAYLNYRILQ